jgi:exosortase
MATSTTLAFPQNSSRHFCFIAFVAISAAIFHHALGLLIQYSQQEDSASHVPLIPIIAVFLIYTERRKIFAVTRTQAFPGVIAIAAALLLYWQVSRANSPVPDNLALSLQILSIVILWIGGFLLCYGLASARTAAFSLLFMLLIVPLPDVILDRIIYWLQVGSTELTYLIFQLVGTPVVRNGFLLSVPGVTIEVAKECSSIRSSIALVITCLLAAHLYLRTTWRMALFVIVALGVSILKNGVRIATLTLLSIYVDPGFLTGRLHRQGGFAFFLLALGILFPLLLLLQKSERTTAPVSGKTPELDTSLVRES